MQVKDKVIVVTGAASGIGKALCERFAMEGASAIVATDINSQGLSATVSDISNRSQTLGITCDVGKEEEASELVEKTLAAFGHIDLFCSNAGIFTPGREDVSTEKWQAIWDARDRSTVAYPAQTLLSREDITHRLGQIRCPVLLIHGEDDQAIPMDKAKVIEAALPDCRGLVRIDGAGHAPNMTHPETVNAAIQRFVSGL